MDPDVALNELRAITAIIRMTPAEHRQLTAEQITDLGERFDALDGWMTSGGFMPVAWRYARMPLYAAISAAEVGAE